MQIAVEDWSPEHGSPVDDLSDVAEATASVDAGIEVPPEEWAARRPPATAHVPTAVFIDGVQRIDAAAYVTPVPGGPTRLGRFASWAAGAVRCPPAGVAEVMAVEVERGLLCPASPLEPVPTRAGIFHAVPVDPDDPAALNKALHYRRSGLEAAVTEAVASGDQVVVADGRLQGGLERTGAVGLVKTHHATYLDEAGQAVVASLESGERTPLFLIRGRAPRTSWYARLPGRRTHPWAGVVRLEVDPGTGVDEAVEVADVVTTLLLRFASEAHKDGRAPQNLYPIAGLERRLRHRLGEREVVLRALRHAAA